MTSEVEERPRLVTGGTGVNGLSALLQNVLIFRGNILLETIASYSDRYSL